MLCTAAAADQLVNPKGIESRCSGVDLINILRACNLQPWQSKLYIIYCMHSTVQRFENVTAISYTCKMFMKLTPGLSVENLFLSSSLSP